MAWLGDSSGLHQAHQRAGQVDDSATDGWHVSVGFGDKSYRWVHLSSFRRLDWESSHGGDGQGSHISKTEEASPSEWVIFKHLLETWQNKLNAQMGGESMDGERIIYLLKG